MPKYLLTLLFLISSSGNSATQEYLAATVTPHVVAPGQVTLVVLSTKNKEPLWPSEHRLSGLEGREMTLWPCPSQKGSFCGLIATHMEALPGQAEGRVNWYEGPEPFSLSIPLLITKETYTETKMKIDPSRAHPSEEEKKRIEDEKTEIETIYRQSNPFPFWSSKFLLPIASVITSRFGNRRTFNGDVKSVHYGLDLRAGIGATIRAPAAGRVVMAKEMFYAGNFVVLDHGAGLFSSYSHLKKIDVAVGQFVQSKEKLGLSGVSGRVTGPHLHWSIKVNGLSVDPEQFLKVFNSQWTSNMNSPKQTKR